MSTVKIISTNTLTFSQRMRAEAARKRTMARRRLVTVVTASLVVIGSCLWVCSLRDKAMEPRMNSIVEMELDRAADAAEANGYDVYVIPGE